MKLRLDSLTAFGLVVISWGCGGPTTSPGLGDDTGTNGASAGRGTVGTGGSAATGGTTSTGIGGATSSAGGATSSAGGATSSAGGTTSSAGGRVGAGGAVDAGASGGGTGGSGGGRPGTVGAAGGGKSAGSGGTGTGGLGATGGKAGATGTAGSAGTGVSSAGAPALDCSTPMPTGGKTYTGSNVNGTADGFNYGIWTNGSGGSITVFTDTPAFSTSWSNSSDFLAHLGLDFRTAKSYTAYGTITAQFVEMKSGSAGSFSAIGIYGWTHSPCVEWYINEDAFNGLYGGGNVTATVDGATYSLSSQMTMGTGGANACESGHTGSWLQIHSTRKTARQCGTVTVSDHFAAWEQQGWMLGTLSMVHINIEVGGGTGSIDFPVANVTTTSN